MAVVASVFLVLAGLIHVYIFVLESLRWRHPATWKIFGLTSQADADTTAPLAYNQGFYNLFLAVGVVLGVILYWAGAVPAGAAIALFAGLSMVLAAAVLISTGRRNLRPASIQGIAPLIGVVTLIIALVA
jgi:putative membrane protein